MLLGLGTAPSVAQPEEMPLGSEMPSATLQRVDGTSIQLQRVVGKTGTVLIFWSNQCPWVDRYEDRVQQLVNRFQSQGFQFILVNSNDATAFPQESLEASRQRASQSGYKAVYARDPGSTLARALGASRTPHVFVFDVDRTLVYVGTIDDSPSDPGNVTKTYLADALTALGEGQEISVPKTKAFGCTIKLQSQ